MGQYKVLIADDDPNVREILRIFFGQHDIDLIEAQDGEEALEKIDKELPDIIILDIMMPKLDGYEVCREVMKKHDIPIIMLTAKGEEFDRVLGLELGADDYVTKPFSPRELMSRIKAVFRRMQPRTVLQTPAYSEEEAEQVFQFPELKIDPIRREVVIKDEVCELRPKEFDLLYHFAKYPGKIFTREQLLEQVWGYDFMGDMRTVDVHVKKLRSKLKHLKHTYIHTVWGVGYKFEVVLDADSQN